MKLIVLTTSDNPANGGFKKLEHSLKLFGYDYEHILSPFSFGHQLPVIQNWCNNYQGDCTHILYTDAWDTLALSTPEEVIDKFLNYFHFIFVDKPPKMLISAEKNCYPHPERAADYPIVDSPWKYVNGGGWLVEIEYFKQLCIKENLNQDSHDQVWLMDAYLRNQDEIKLDTECEIFQTIAFSDTGEWFYNHVKKRLENKKMQTYPIFFHGNGHTDMEWVYKVLGLSFAEVSY